MGWYRWRNEPKKVDEVFQATQNAVKDDPAALKLLARLKLTDPKDILEGALADARQEPDEIIRRLRMADAYMKFNQQDRALEHLEKAEAKDSKNPLVVANLFNYHLAAKKLDLAEKYAAAAASADLDKVGGRFYRARIAFAQQKWDEAIRLAREIVRLQPMFDGIHVFLGDCYVGAGKPEQAKAAYQEAFDENRGNYRALLGLLTLSRGEGAVDDYKRHLRKAYERNPRHPLVQEEYLRVIAAREEPEKAIKHREVIAKRNPNNLLNMSQLARLYERTGQNAKAKPIYRSLAIRPDAGHLDVRQYVRFLRATNLDQEARAILAKYVEEAEEKVGAYLVWGEYLTMAGDFDMAEAAYNKAIEADKTGRRAYFSTARFFALRGDWAKAAEHQQKYLAAAGEGFTADDEFFMIICLLQAKEYAKAGERIDKALAENSDRGDMLALKGRLLFRQDKNTEAKSILDRALVADAANFHALAYRSELYLAQGDIQNAVADMELALRARLSEEIALKLAGVHDRQGGFVKAHSVLQQFLAERPESVPVRREIVSLCLRWQRWGQMETELREAKKALPGDPFFWQKEGERWLDAKSRDPTKAMAALAKAKQLAPGSPTINLLILRTLVLAGRLDEAVTLGERLSADKDVGTMARATLGWAHMKRKDSARAEKEFTESLKAAKSGEELSLVFGQILMAYGGDPVAMNPDKWIAARPDDWEMKYLAGLSTIGAGKAAPADRKELVDQAVGFLEAALVQASDETHKAMVRRELGLLYAEQGRYKKSAEAYKSALKSLPDDGRTLNNLAWLLAKDMNNHAEALPYAKRAAELAARNPSVLDTYGFVLLLNKQYSQAREVMRRSTDIGEFPANLLHYGIVLEKLGEREDAFRQYKAGWEKVKETPEDENYQELREAFMRLGGKPEGSTGP